MIDTIALVKKCLIVMVGWCLALDALACSPAPSYYFDIYHPYAEADMVFIGKIRSITGVPNETHDESEGDFFKMTGYTAEFEVLKVYKGLDSDFSEITIESEHTDHNTCGVPSPFMQAELGKIWVVMAKRDAAWWINGIEEPNQQHWILLNPHYEPYAFDSSAQYQPFASLTDAHAYLALKIYEIDHDGELRQQRERDLLLYGPND